MKGGREGGREGCRGGICEDQDEVRDGLREK
jgi:hypothetical protein